MIQSRNLTGQLFAVASLLVMGIVVVGCDLNGDSSNSNSSGSSNLDKDLRGEWTDDLATNASTLDMAFWQDTEDEDDDNKKKELLLALRDFWRDQPWDSGTETVTIDGNDFTRVAGTGTGTDGWFEQTSVTPNQDLYLNGLTGRFELYTQTNNWPTLIEGTFHLPTSTTITFTIHRSGDVSLNKSKSYLNTQWRVTNESWRYEMYPGPELQILGKTLLRDEPGLFGDTWSSADDTLQLAFLSDGTVEFIRQRLVGGKRAWAQLRVYDFVDEGGASGGWIRVAERLYADYDLNKDKDELTFYIDYPRVERRWSVINGGDTLQLGDKTSDLSLDRVFGVGSELEGTWDNGGELWSFDSDAGTYEIEDGGGNITEEGNFVLVDNDERIRFLRTSVLDKR